MNKNVEKKLIEQIEAEFAASHLYLSIASWADKAGWKGVAHFFYQQSEEERMHALKIVQFVNDRDGDTIIPAVALPRKDFKDINEVFELLLKSELEVTAKINLIVDVCRNEKDYITDQFMDWYLTEQLEEETAAKELLDELKIIDKDKGGLYAFDQKLQKTKKE